MLDFSRVQNHYILCGYTDMRKQIDNLAASTNPVRTGNGKDVALSVLQKASTSYQGAVLGQRGIYPAVQASDGKEVPVTTK